ncbi:MAG: DUF6491 family protein [Phenylobacterium sp.]
MKLAPIALVGATLVGAMAPALAANAAPLKPGLPSDQCFYSRDMRNHTILDNHTMLVDVAGRYVYRITMSGACLAGAVSSDPIITRQPPGSSHICRPIDMDIAIGGRGIPTPCIVQSIARLTPAEVAAIPPRKRP